MKLRIAVATATVLFPLLCQADMIVDWNRQANAVWQRRDRQSREPIAWRALGDARSEGGRWRLAACPG